jgi:putative transposase
MPANNHPETLPLKSIVKERVLPTNKSNDPERLDMIITSSDIFNQKPLSSFDKPGNQALRRGRVSLPNQVYLITTATRNRQRFFEDFSAACVAARCFSNSGILGDACLLAWVLMPDHVHWLLQLGVVDGLDLVVNRLKSASARKANNVLHRAGALWQAAYYDRALRAEEDLREVARYLVANPIRAGLVKHVGDYPFWNAVWL